MEFFACRHATGTIQMPVAQCLWAMEDRGVTVRREGTTLIAPGATIEERDLLIRYRHHILPFLCTQAEHRQRVREAARLLAGYRAAQQP